MATSPPRRNKIRPSSAKEVSVLAWIQDVYGNVLFVQQTAGKELWSLPGGKVRSHEALKIALKRELKEEIGLTVTSARIIDVFDRPQKGALAVLFHVILRKGLPKLADSEIKDFAYLNQLPTPATPSARYFWPRQFPPAPGTPLRPLD
jgi:ADP-ribose pyrophosphatase YjhB (NUDIX family)